MFLHHFKYEFLNLIRQKDTTFWLLVFPFILSTFFYIAFGNLSEQEFNVTKIPVAIVEEKTNETFNTVINQVSTGDEALFDVKYTDGEKALKLLEDEKISGIIYVDEKIDLSVATSGIKETIIKSFLSRYKTQETIITETAATNPAQLQSLINALSKEISPNKDIPISNNEIDIYSQFFHNLIAMVALLSMTCGISIATGNQGNLSPIGARKCVSPTPKGKSMLASFTASYLVQLICVFLVTTYIIFVLKIDMGNKLGFIYLSGALGTLLGISFGFFFGSIGKLSENVKIMISTGISMFLCFLSGLMVGNMKGIIASVCPIINKLNPAAVISDMFYCLSIYDDLTRYIEKVITVLVMTVIFTSVGFLLTRRKKYASI
ncbi:MAG: ABC transporter permease [Clostridiales bacterium]|nr:ABC transporter permease [Clostridiales bacterium]